jgi:hypothetical protein
LPRWVDVDQMMSSTSAVLRLLRSFSAFSTVAARCWGCADAPAPPCRADMGSQVAETGHFLRSVVEVDEDPHGICTVGGDSSGAVAADEFLDHRGDMIPPLAAVEDAIMSGPGGHVIGFFGIGQIGRDIERCPRLAKP